MTIQDYLIYLEKNAEEGREILRPLMDVLCPVSKQTMKEFQNKHFLIQQRNFKKFVEEQNKLLIECINVETSPFGDTVREILNLPHLTLETVVAE